ncbi:MAG TPA: hypothetical protein DCY20_05590 [Firmicutes bacterium]|nr:hypothetical protein [Bacillota bacterium]
MKKNYLILIGLTFMFVIIAFYSNQMTQLKNISDPEVIITLNNSTIPYSSINYDYKSLLSKKKTELSNDQEKEFLITTPKDAEQMLTLSSTAEPSDVTYRILYDQDVVYEGTLSPNLSELIFNSNDEEVKQGIYTVEVEWNYSNYHYLNNITLNGTGTSTFKLNVNIPLTASISDTTFNPGEFITVQTRYGTDSQTIKVNTNLSSQAINIYEVNGNYEALIPLDYRLTSGDYDLNIEYYENDILTHEEPYTITILAKEFPTQHLIMPESTSASTLTAESSAEYSQILYQTRALKTTTRYFEDTFIAPTYGIITTDFALTRYTNDNPVPTKHLAIDIAADTGTEILAFASGKAVVSRFLQLTGNTIMIDHGHGLISYYYHLDELNIAEGDMVNQSDLIGTVGSTGYSTGPHLHFAISLNEVYLNPWFFFPFDGFEMDED